MFDYAVTGRRDRTRSSRAATAGISLALHSVVIAGLLVSALLATDTLPEPPTMMAFVVDAVAPPPPPPPPPAPPPEARPAPAKPARTAVVRPPRPAVPVVPAPIEAPSGITAETGLEAYSGAESAVAAGFEGGISGGVTGGVIGGLDFGLPPPPPPPRVAPAPVRVGGQITAPRLIRRVEPVYPPIAQTAQVEGLVILEATVDTTGHVTSLRVLRSHSVLEGAAMDAVRQWEYEPLVLNDVPMPFVLTVTVSFNIARP